MCPINALFPLAVLPAIAVALVRNESFGSNSSVQNSQSPQKFSESLQNSSSNLRVDWQPNDSTQDNDIDSLQSAIDSFVQSRCVRNAAIFGQKTGNAGCSRNAGPGVTSFDNIRTAPGCSTRPTITIPHSFYETIDDLRSSGGSTAVSTLTAMLSEGFMAFRSKGHRGAVMQCIHKPGFISVHWLHLHSFCPGSHFEDMPGGTAYCEIMSSVDDAGAIAQRLVR
mmetsp:Transcript_89215/g.158159  ORF Transcript_89215/g.158159 Transcript_89215/m.158159 type:complete len:224 (+) Transcript_89215:85-756(+)